MCGRYTFQPTEEFYRRFNIANRLDGLVARYNIAPSQLVPVIISQLPHQVMFMRWGLIPHWAKEEKTDYKMINARMETLTQRPASQSLLAANRCMIPASGYYEWKAEARGKTPYYSTLQAMNSLPSPASTTSGPTPMVRRSIPLRSSRKTQTA
jgi:putative SOS response-associated peptidase YedK